MITGRVGCSLAAGHAPRWVFVVGRAFLVAIPATTSQDVVDRLTAVIARDAIEIETLVSLIPLSGANAVQSFIVIVVPTGDSQSATGDGSDGVLVSAVIRGAIVADMYSVGGSRRFSDSDIRPWLLADFQSVTGVAISDPSAPVLPAAELGRGVIVASSVMPGEALYWSRELAASCTATTAAAERAAEPVPVPEQAPALTLSPATLSPATGFDATDTVLRAPAPTRPGDADTVLNRPGLDVDTELSQPAIFRPPETAPVPAIVQATFRFAVQNDQGTSRRFELSTPYLLGRRPNAPRVSQGPHPQLVTVDSPTAAVSRTHLEIRQVGDSVVVTDLGSTNGTHVISLTGTTQRLQPRGSLTVLPGMRVDIGDGNIIQILPVDATLSRPPAHLHSERRHL